MGLIKSGGGFFNGKGLLGAGNGHVNNGQGNVGGKGNGGGGGGNSSGSLPITNNIWGAFGLSRQINGWRSAVIRVRRDSDDTEKDIGLTSSGNLNVGDLLSFVGAGNGYIVKWYDQAGSAHDLSQATTTKQPLIVDTGVYLQELLFDGTDDFLQSAANSGTPTAFTIIWAGRNRLGAQGRTSLDEFIFSHASGFQVPTHYTSTDALGYRANIANNTTNVGINAFASALADDFTAWAAQSDLSKASLTTQLRLYKNGTAQTSLSTGGAVASGTYAAGIWTLGSAAGTSGFTRLAIRGFYLYEIALTATNIQTISTAIRPGYQTGVFDNFTTGLWGLYSLRKQLTSYSGSCIRVRRSNDNVEADIGFSSGYLDTVALLAHTGSNSGFITKWYDQSGASHDFSQATAAQQPRIVNSGIVDVAVVYSGGQIMSTANSGTVPAFTAVIKGTINTSSGVILEQSTAFVTNTGAIVSWASGRTNVFMSQTTNANLAASLFDNSLAGGVLVSRWNRAAATKTLQAALLSGGVLQTRATNADAGTAISGNFTAAPWFLGSRSGLVSPMTGSLETVALYESALSDTNAETISRMVG